jgi:hypothetical protein
MKLWRIGDNMKREEIISKLLNTVITNCQNFSDYNDNTLHDFLMFGFKGLTNMTDEELQTELNSLTEWENEE